MKKHKKQMKHLNRRGDVSMALIAIVLAVAGLLVSAPIAYRFVAGSEERTQEKVCENSVALRARTQIDAGSSKATLKAMPMLCKTQEKYITGNREEIKDQFAQYMASCWQMFGAGRYDEILHGFTSSLFPESKNKCFVCYTLIVDENEIEGGPISSDDLLKYLLVTPYPKGKDLTYLEFLQSGGRGRILYLVTDSKGRDTPIQARHGYGISFEPKLKEISDSAFWSGLAKISGAAVGVFVLGMVTAGFGWLSLLGIGAGTLVIGSGYSDVKAALHGERVVSSIYLDTLPSAQEDCFAGDLASVIEE